LSVLPFAVLPFALLCLLPLLPLLPLPLPFLQFAILQSALEGFHAAHEIARLVGGAANGILLRLLADCTGSVADLFLQRVEVGREILFHPARVLRSGALQRAFGVADLLADPFVPDAAGRFIEL